METKKHNKRLTKVIVGLCLMVMLMLVSGVAMAKTYNITFNDHNPLMSG